MYNKHAFKEVIKMPDDDIIKMDTDIILKDSSGKPIQVETPKPEYITETFEYKPNTILTSEGDGE